MSILLKSYSYYYYPIIHIPSVVVFIAMVSLIYRFFLTFTLKFESYLHFSLSFCQSLLLSVWLQREKEVLQKPEESVRNLHTLLIALSNMKGVYSCPVCEALFSLCVS